MRPRPRVVIVGAGFGGLNAAKQLAPAPVDVLLVDRHNYHLFSPLLYQVASGLIDPSDVAHPVRAVLRHARNVDVLMAEVTGVDLERHRLHTSAGDERFDTLVLATGSATNFFGITGLEERAIGLKDLPEALALRAHVLRAFEAASTCTDPTERRRLLTFAIAGAGPTGVEYSGALAELIRHVLPKDFPRLDVNQARVVLIEGSDRVLGGFSKGLSRDATRRLKRMGVEVLVGRFVKDVDDHTLVLDSGRRINAETVVWTAGVRATPVAERLGVEPSSLGRVRVTPALNVPGHDEVFVIGDAAEFEHRGEPLPMLAPVAIQQGKHVARVIEARLDGKPDPRFRYLDKGTMATVGRGAAVVQLGPIKVDGLLGWLMWVFVHLLYLIGFRSRVIVFVTWAWNYFFYDRPVRLIVGQSADERRITSEEP
ncbi:MAG TPA: NAD(P)/FAD-dependent oxidoreductase [Candidatus Dormibacteraeota bacterium]